MTETMYPESRWTALRALYLVRLNKLLRNPLGMVGAVLLLALVVVAALAPVLAPYDPLAQSLVDRLQAPTVAHWFGTDESGRDILSRMIYGARITLYIISVVAAIVGPVGLCFGMVAGYFGGWVDDVLMRVTDIFLALPGLILALAFVTALGPGLENAVLAIALTMWPPIARLARAETLSIRNADYIEAMRLNGASSARILLRHILPVCLPSVIVRITLNMAAIILVASGLGFLGLGAQPPLPEWGAMLARGREYIGGYWWMTAVPGITILIVSLGFNLLGDALRDVLDPRAL